MPELNHALVPYTANAENYTTTTTCRCKYYLLICFHLNFLYIPATKLQLLFVCLVSILPLVHEISHICLDK